MARSFSYQSTAYLQAPCALKRAFPFSMAVWFNAQANPPTNYDFISVDSGDFSLFGFTFGISTNHVGGDVIEAYVADAGGNYFRVDVGSSVISQGWIPAVLSCASASSRTIYTKQGGSFLSNTDTTTITLDGNSYAEASVGTFRDGTGKARCNAFVAQAAIWTIALSAADAQSFCNGTLPYKIQRASLRNWWPVWGLNLPEPDSIGGSDLTLSSSGTTPAFVTDPPVQPYIISVPPMVQGAEFQPTLGGGNVLQAVPAQTLTFVETWNPNDAGSEISFSNGNLTVSVPFLNLGTRYWNARGTVPHSTGKYYFEFTSNSIAAGPGNVGIGIAKAAASLGGTNSTWFGSDNNSAAIYWNATTPGLWFGGSAAANYPGYTITTASVGRIAVDIGAGLFWFNFDNQGWNGFGSSNDPGAGTGGANLGAFLNPGAWFPGVTLDDDDSNSIGDTLTGVFDASAFTYRPPNGFSAWGGTKVGLSGNSQSVLYGTNLRGRIG